MTNGLKARIKAWLDENKYYYKFLDKTRSLFVSRSEKETGWFIGYWELEMTTSFEILINTYLDRLRKSECPDGLLDEEDEEEEDDELFKEISE